MFGCFLYTIPAIKIFCNRIKCISKSYYDVVGIYTSGLAGLRWFIGKCKITADKFLVQFLKAKNKLFSKKNLDGKNKVRRNRKYKLYYSPTKRLMNTF